MTRRRSVRGRLTMLVTVSILPLVFLGLSRDYLDYRRELATAKQRTLGLAQSISLLVQQELERRIAALEVLAPSPTLEAGDFDRFQANADAVVKHLFPGSEIRLLNEDGQLPSNTSQSSSTARSIDPNLEVVHRVFASGQPAVSNLFHDADGQRSKVSIDVPVSRDNGPVAYVLSIIPQTDSFDQILRQRQPPDGWVVSVLDRRGEIVARFPSPERFVGQTVSPEFLGHLLGERDGVVEGTSREGIPLLAAFTHTGPFGWAVAVGVPRTDVNSPATLAVARTLAIGAVVLSLSLVFAFYTARQIAEPIAALGRLASLPERDVPANPPPMGLREVDDVARALSLAEDRRRNSEQLEANLRSGIDTMPAGFVMYDHDDRLVICNEAYRQFYPETSHLLVSGIRFADILRAGIVRGRFPAAKGREEEWIAERIHRQREPHSTIEQQLDDGRWVLVTKHCLPNGWVAGLRVDITALREAQQGLLESEQMARGIIETALDGFVQITARGVISEWNHQAESIFGWSRDEVLGKPLSDFIVPLRHRPLYWHELAKLLESGHSTFLGKRLELELLRRDGNEFRVELTVTALLRQDGYVVNGFIRDLTQKIKTEAMLNQAQKMEAIGNLTGGMAHDFNNMLGVIVGNLDELREMSLATEALERVNEAIDAALLGAELTGRLLAFARRQALQPKRIELNGLVSNMVKLLRRTLGEEIDISVDLPSEVWPVVVDPGQLESAIVNLATNARDAMMKGGKLLIKTGNRHLDADYAAMHVELSPGDYAMVEVSDNGIGMPPEVMHRIFEPFFTTKETGKGTGLGLSMVFGFVKQSGGHINVYSEPGQGTTFRLYLPRGDQEQPGGLQPEPIGDIAGGHDTILVVEDNPGLRRATLRQIAALGYRVLAAENADAAFDLLSTHQVDLMFSDVVMPGDTNGVELAQEAVARQPSLKVLLTSGFSDSRLNGNREALVGIRLLSKPYRRDELARTIREILDA